MLIPPPGQPGKEKIMAGKYIYEPKGRAREYAALAVNLHKGCPHACDYCYVRRNFGITDTDTTIRKGLIAGVTKDAAQLQAADDQREIVLCFLCDPYPYRNPQAHTSEVIRILLGAGRRVAVLTKGGSTVLHDLNLFSQFPALVRVGQSLTCWSEETRRKWEPGAAPAQDRVAALKVAHETGLATWASVEPVIVPSESVEVIRRSAGVVDQYNIGWINHVSHAPNKRHLAAIVRAAMETGARVALKRDAAQVLTSLGESELVATSQKLYTQEA
jgi:DNA repair photolyase